MYQQSWWTKCAKVYEKNLVYVHSQRRKAMHQTEHDLISVQETMLWFHANKHFWIWGFLTYGGKGSRRTKKKRRECIIRLRKFSSVGKGTIDTAILTLRKRCKQIYFPLIFISSNEMVTRVTVKKSTVCLLLSFKFFLLPFFFLRDPGITSSYVKTQDCSVFSTPTQTKYHSLFGTIFQ